MFKEGLDATKKGTICELRMKPAGLLIRRAPQGYWRMATLDQKMSWMSDPKNTRVEEQLNARSTRHG